MLRDDYVTENVSQSSLVTLPRNKWEKLKLTLLRLLKKSNMAVNSLRTCVDFCAQFYQIQSFPWKYMFEKQELRLLATKGKIESKQGLVYFNREQRHDRKPFIHNG